MSEVKVGIVGCASMYKQINECTAPIKASFKIYSIVPTCTFNVKADVIRNYLNKSIIENNITIIVFGNCHPQMSEIISEYHDVVVRLKINNCFEMFLGEEKYTEFHNKCYLMLTKPFFTKFKIDFLDGFELNTVNGRNTFKETFKKVVYLKFENDNLRNKIIEDYANLVGLDYEIFSVDIENLKKLIENTVISASSSKIINLLERKIARKTAELVESEKKNKEALNLINFYKDLFAHDMKNILQGIISSVDFNEMFRNDSERLESLGDLSEVVKSQAMRGSSLINKIMILTRLNNIHPELSAIKVFEVLNKAMENILKDFQKRNVNIEIKGLTEDMEILGNDLLIEVFDNILNNAVKYNDNEENVKISIKVSKIIEDDVSYLNFEFIDYGIGVTDVKKKKLFKEAYSKEISKRGMGIGLSLVKKIVDTYGGKIWVKNRIKGDYKKGIDLILLFREA